MAMYILFFLFIIIPSILEGIGIWVDRRIFLLFFSSIVILFYFYSTTTRVKSIKIPLKAGIIYLCFLCFSAISTFFFSVDKQNSFELLLFYYASFLFFIFFYNHKDVTNWIAHYFSIILGIFFTFYSVLLPIFTFIGLHFLQPISEKQFVFASYLNHNHLGDFLGLLLVVLCYYSLQRKFILIPFIAVFFIVFIGSFSRSAYIAFLIVFLLMLFDNRKKVPSFVLPLVFLFLSTIVFATYMISIQQPKNSAFYSLQEYGRKVLHFTPRETISGHDIFIKQALLSIGKFPYFGVGGGNFITASRNNIIDNTQSDSAHNIFFELATEQGIIAALCFGLFIFLISKYTFSIPTLPGFLFLYLLINFQTDYTYQVYFLFLFWIILSSVVYAEKKEVTIPPILYGLLCLVPLVILMCFTTSVLFIRMGDYKKATYWYPFNKEAYIAVIKNDYLEAPSSIRNMEQIAPYDLTYIMNAAKYYLKLGDKKQALIYYERVYQMNRLCSFYFIKQIYTLKKELGNQSQANYFLNGVVHDYQTIFASNSLKKEISDFCKEVKLTSCPKVGWND